MIGAVWARRFAQILALSSVLVIGCARPHFPGYVIEPYETETEPGATAVLPGPDSSDAARRCNRILAIEIRKSERALLAQCSDGEQLRFRAALGREPRGPKERQGDLRTPEGSYRVAGPARESRFYLFLPIDYPGEHDADRAVELGLITPKERDAIHKAREEQRLPPQWTRLGGNLGLHGEGERWQGDSEGLNWTYGCVALADRDIEYLASRVTTGTPVLILP
jgi:murein L,D-transpeptidase YafK